MQIVQWLIGLVAGGGGEALADAGRTLAIWDVVTDAMQDPLGAGALLIPAIIILALWRLPALGKLKLDWFSGRVAMACVAALIVLYAVLLMYLAWNRSPRQSQRDARPPDRHVERPGMAAKANDERPRIAPSAEGDGR